MRRPNYDRFPTLPVPTPHEDCACGWDAIVTRIKDAVRARAAARTVITVECYAGVHEDAVAEALVSRLRPAHLVRAADLMRASTAIERMVEPFIGGADPVFGFLCGLTLDQYFDPARLATAVGKVEEFRSGLVLIIGCGATLIHEGDLLVYADLSRWEAQNRFRRNESWNLGTPPQRTTAAERYKRAFFVDWRVCDRWKRPLIRRWDFLLDTHDPVTPKLARGEDVRRALRHAATRPFRLVPFFDPAPWGGQWMKEVCNLDPSSPNYGWCFDGVPEENSLLLDFGTARVEIPALNLVFDQPRALLGDAVHARFGDEFPIRFDLLDTMGGGNLSFQVHPLTEYIQSRFGMHYTQDESYYLLDAGPDAQVYLGLREGIDPAAMARDLRTAQAGGAPFDAQRYAQSWPARRHDHFLIPAGTAHCSGANSMVLEISATPYIFTFKMWDWGRLGLDGRPRPIHLDHGLANLQWDRTTEWTRRELVNQVQPLASGPGWREERTGLHAREFIETRRHWFTGPVPHHTGGGVNVLNLVQGEEAVVESPDGAFTPFIVHFAETFIVPAAVGSYSVRPWGDRTAGDECATLKALVRTGLP